jgi:hypothetical protein
LRFQRSKIHEWGLVALELIQAEDFVIEYVGDLIRKRVIVHYSINHCLIDVLILSNVLEIDLYPTGLGHT